MKIVEGERASQRKSKMCFCNCGKQLRVDSQTLHLFLAQTWFLRFAFLLWFPSVRCTDPMGNPCRYISKIDARIHSSRRQKVRQSWRGELIDLNLKPSRTMNAKEHRRITKKRLEPCRSELPISLLHPVERTWQRNKTSKHVYETQLKQTRT